MTAKEIFAKVRMSPEVADMNSAKVSDWQLLDALNSVLNVLHNELCIFHNNLLNKSAWMHLDGGDDILPADFGQAVNVYRGDVVLRPATKGEPLNWCTYEIRGNRIHAFGDILYLDYKPAFHEIAMDEIEDDLPYPSYLKELIKKQVIAALSGNMALQDMAVTVRQMVANREFNHLDVHGAWSEQI